MSDDVDFGSNAYDTRKSNPEAFTNLRTIKSGSGARKFHKPYYRDFIHLRSNINFG